MDTYQALWLAFAIVWTLAAFATKRTVRRQTSTSRIVQSSLVVFGFLLLLRPWILPALDIRVIPDSPPINFCGIVLTAAGIALAIWARLVIGTNWSGSVTVKRNHQLIRTGPYRFVRHPIYSGILLAMLGTAVGYGMLPGLIGFALTFIALLAKWQIEEKFMIEEFGDQYHQYRREVKAVIPGLL